MLCIYVNVYACTHAYFCAHVGAFMYTCVYMYLPIHTYVRKYIHTYIHAYIECVCVRVCVYTNIHTYIYTFIHSYTHTHTHMHTHMHTHTHTKDMLKRSWMHLFWPKVRDLVDLLDVSITIRVVSSVDPPVLKDDGVWNVCAPLIRRVQCFIEIFQPRQAYQALAVSR